MATSFETFLSKFSESDWLAAVDSLARESHEVDRNAMQIWFRFYPLQFRRFIESNAEESDLRRSLGLLGEFDLADQIDSSHVFLYGHRYWKTVKAALEAEAAVFTDQQPELADEIRQIASNIAEKLKADVSLLIGITALGAMTLNEVGLEKFKAAEGQVQAPRGSMARSPNQIVAERRRDDSQGLLGFLRTVDKKFTVTYIDKIDSGKFQIISDEEIATASARDQSKNWRERDERCWEGVVPVECRSASCGTCWIGVLAGEEKLSAVDRRERRMMKVFGYNQPADEKPILRLACQTKAYGNATIVIPPWNGVFGKKIYGNVEDLELEPVTTSAQKLRETIATATVTEE